MIKSIHHVLQSRMFGIVAVLASATIATLIATDAVNPYPTLKLAYFICAVMGLTGLLQLAYQPYLQRNRRSRRCQIAGSERNQFHG